MRTLLLVIILFALIATGCTSSNRTRQHNPAQSWGVLQFNKMNSDGDRDLPLEDAKTYLATEFIKLDTDNNQLLTFVEYQANKPKNDKLINRFNGLDSNRDKDLSPKELQIEVNDFFNRFDKNRDSVVTLKEVKMGGKTGHRKGSRTGH